MGYWKCSTPHTWAPQLIVLCQGMDESWLVWHAYFEAIIWEITLGYTYFSNILAIINACSFIKKRWLRYCCFLLSPYIGIGLSLSCFISCKIWALFSIVILLESINAQTAEEWPDGFTEDLRPCWLRSANKWTHTETHFPKIYQYTVLQIFYSHKSNSCFLSKIHTSGDGVIR